MSVAINHAISALINPLAIALVALFLGIIFCRRMVGKLLLILAFGVLVTFSLPVVEARMGLWLEGDYPARNEAVLEGKYDAIVVLGGGMYSDKIIDESDLEMVEWRKRVEKEGGLMPHPDMNAGADRVWAGARLYHAGVAPKIIITGVGCQYSTIPLLKDLGVPEAAIVPLIGPGNTEEEAKAVAEVLKAAEGTRPRVVLVTSAWHMRRAALLFRQGADYFDFTPIAADHMASTFYGPMHRFELKDLVPSTTALDHNNTYFKELFAYCCYHILKGYR